jgi:hypothetical protein
MNHIDDRWSKKNLCDGCKLPFTKEEWGDRHTAHEPDCENFGRSFYERQVNCTCDLVYHSKCCPECYPKKSVSATPV